MSFRSTRWFLGMAVGGAIALGANSAIAQITPDRTLPNNSTVTVNGSTFNITGGTTAGRNLFHSFQQFSVPTGGTASFNNAADIQNIFSRVTGGALSNIDGLIKANGTANLFLINPNGIVFGKNARLNIGGSFVASTASSLKFADGFEFSATAPETTPLLTVSVPTGLQYGENPGSILNLSQASDSSGQLIGLQVQPGKTLALVGGNMSLNGGSLNATGGRVELGGVSGSGTVELSVNSNNLGLSFSDNVPLADISLNNGAILNLSSNDIQVTARRVILTDNSQIVANTLESKSGGTLTVTAYDSVQLFGGSALSTQSLSSGNAGNLTINTRRLIVRDGAQISTGVFGTGRGGNLTVNASESLELSGISADAQFPGGLFAGTYDTGSAGNLTINTRRLIVRDGAQISTGVFGTGQGGNLTVNASESLELSGISADAQFPGGLFSSIYPEATGAGGNLTVETGRLLIHDGAQVSTATFGLGSAGNLNVRANDVELIGTSANGKFPSGLRSAVERGAFGNGGDLNFAANRLVVRDGAQITASNEGTGRPGDIQAEARLIFLNNQGSLKAESVSGSGGNISLRALDLVLLKNNSLISAISNGSDYAGNIIIDSGFLIALEKSNIIANAANSRANLAINAQGFLFSPDSEIIVNGEKVTDRLPRFLLTVAEPPVVRLANAHEIIKTSCAAFDTGGSSFTVTGRGGLPPSPDEPLTNDVIWTDTRIPTTTSQHSSNKPPIKPHSKPKAEPIVIAPATGWVFNGNGEVTLISSTHNANSLGTTPATCPVQR